MHLKCISIQAELSPFKWTVSVISSDPPYIGDTAPFTTGPCALYLINNLMDIVVF